MQEHIQEVLAIEIAEKAVVIARMKAENNRLHQQVADLTAQLDEARKPKEVMEDGV